MIIFIRNIPEQTSKNDLVVFVEPALKGRLPFTSGKILDVQILVLLDKHTKLVEYHGLVDVDSIKAGHKAIKKLNGARLNNKIVMVREYMTRSWHNDRRLDQAKAVDTLGKGLRKGDRRRGKNLEVVLDVSNLFKGSKNSARKAF